MKQRMIIWTGGQSHGWQDSERLAEAMPVLPVPAPLHHMAVIEYQWGVRRFEIASTACSLRTTPWGNGQMTWLHCAAMTTGKFKPDEPTSLIAALIPAHYVTGIQPGPEFRITRYRRCPEIGLFPPNQVAPPNPVPLAEIERVLTELLAPELN